MDLVRVKLFSSILSEETELELSLCCGESAIFLFTAAPLEAVEEDAFRVRKPSGKMELNSFTLTKSMDCLLYTSFSCLPLT